MVPNAIILRSVERRDNLRILVVAEIVGQQSIVRSVELDEMTYEGVVRAFQTHPFRRRRPDDDVLLFKSLDTPLGTDKKYFGLQIVNQGSRHDLKIEASSAAFAEMKSVLESWCARVEAARAVHPKTEQLEGARPARQQAAGVMQAMLRGDMGLAEGARLLSCLRHELFRPHQFDADFGVIMSLDSATSHLPVGDVRRHWSDAAVAAKEKELREAEDLARPDVLQACRSVLSRMGAA